MLTMALLVLKANFHRNRKAGHQFVNELPEQYPRKFVICRTKTERTDLSLSVPCKQKANAANVCISAKIYPTECVDKMSAV